MTRFFESFPYFTTLVKSSSSDMLGGSDPTITRWQCSDVLQAFLLTASSILQSITGDICLSLASKLHFLSTLNFRINSEKMNTFLTLTLTNYRVVFSPHPQDRSEIEGEGGGEGMGDQPLWSALPEITRFGRRPHFSHEIFCATFP